MGALNSPESIIFTTTKLSCGGKAPKQNRERQKVQLSPIPGLGAVHAVPTVAKQTVKYKTAAFEPVEADTPADAQLIELKETEHSYDTLVPGPVNYVHTPAVYGYGLHGGLLAAPAIAAAAEPVELPAIELPTTYAAHALLGYPAALGYHGLGLPIVPAAAPAAAEAEE